jgi:serine/threonine protein kinase/WD40 repeat protein
VVPERIGPYRVIRRCGAGGMGEVYLAQDTRLERSVALKFLPEEFTRDAGRRQRFFSEARAAAALAHPHICTVYDVAETEDARPYIAMEWLEGPTLRERLTGAPLPLDEMLEVGLQVAEALEAAHARGIVHRDVKPGNVSLTASGLVKVLDFGLAKWMQPRSSTEGDSRTTVLETESGQIMGTPGYMSPEQATGKPVDQRTDLFSLGVMLYEMATGRVPFGGSNWAEILRGIVERQPEPMVRFNGEVPAELERIVMKCLQKAPGKRYQSASELRIDLAAFQASLAAPRSTASGPLVTFLCLEVPEALRLKGSGRLQAAAELIRQEQGKLQKLLSGPEGRVEAVADLLLARFGRPSEAVQVALRMVSESGVPCRLGLHLGEVIEPEQAEPLRRYGVHLETGVRLMQLAEPGHILMSRGVFDSARVVVKGGEVAGLGALSWVSHGPYEFTGMEEPLEVCEVGFAGRGVLSAPRTTERAKRQVRPEEEPVLGWRPAIGQEVPNTKWTLEEKLGEGGFGEVWQARHEKLNEKRVFKFCFRADRVRSLKREVTLFRLIKERIGEHPNIVRLYDFFFDQPPFYLEEEHVAGRDLRSWCETQGSVEKVPLEVRLEIVAQVADGLQAAHDAGVIHRDVKPGNILMSGTVVPETGHEVPTGPQGISKRSGSVGIASTNIRAKLTDFGVSQLISSELLAGVTEAGFTQTTLGSESSSQTGTRLYMAPELWEGKPASTRSDIYSLGVVLYQLLVGDFTRPLTTDWANDIPDPLLREDLHHCVAGKPEDRFAAAALLAKNLRALPERRVVLERRAAEKAALERAAYRSGMMRTAAVASVILAVILVLACVVWAIALRATRQAAEIRSATVRLTVANGLTPADSGDWLSAALWFSEAFVLDEEFEVAPDPKLSRQSHLLRINSVLRQSPRLEQMWFGKGDHYGCFDPLGERILLGGTNGYRFYSIQSGKPASPLMGAGHTIASLGPDGRRLVTAGDSTNSLVTVWDLSSGVRLLTLEDPGGKGPFRGGCQDLEFSPDGHWVAAVVKGDGGRVVIWDAETARVQQTFSYASTPNVGWTEGQFVLAVRFDPGGKRLLTTGMDRRAVVWQWETGRPLQILEGHRSWVYSGSFGRVHTNWLVTCSFDRSARLWDLRTPQQSILRVEHEGDAISEVQFSPDDRAFVTAGLDSTVRLWDSETGQMIRPVLRTHDRVIRVQWSADAARLLAVNWDGTVRVWRLRAKKPVMEPANGDFSDDGRQALSFDAGAVRVQSTTATGKVSAVELVGTNVVAVGFAGESNRFLCFSGATSAGVGRFELREFAKPRPLGDPVALDPGWSRLVCAPNGKRIAFYGGREEHPGIAKTRGTLIWEPEGAAGPRNIVFPNEVVEAVAFDHEGRRLAVGSLLPQSGAGVLRLVNLESSEEPKELLRPPQRLAHVEFSQDGQWLVATRWDEGLDPGEAVIFHSDGPGRPFVQESRLPHLDGVLYAAFSDSGKAIATASEDQTAIVWQRNRGTWQPSIRPLRCGGQVYLCAFSHNGRWLATASRTPESQQTEKWGSHVRIWDIVNNEAVSLPLAFTDMLTRLVFVDGDTRLFAERWVLPGPPERWIIDLAVKEGSAKELLLLSELLSAQRSFLSGRVEHLPQALEGKLSAEEALIHATSVGPLRPLSKEDCRDLWLHLSLRVTPSP